jgi:hypothetical protein
MPVKILPCEATLIEWNEADRTGILSTPDGERVKCGATSFVESAFPILNHVYMLEEITERPVIGIRASRVSEGKERPKGGFQVYIKAPAPPIPTNDLKSALEWLFANDDVKRPKTGTTTSKIVDYEKKHKIAFPEGYKRFLQDQGFVQATNITIFGFAEDEPDVDIETQRAELVRYVEEVGANGPKAVADVIRGLIPIAAMGGNPLTSGMALLVDAMANLYCLDLRYFSTEDSVDPIAKDFEGALLEELTGWYEDW